MAAGGADPRHPDTDGGAMAEVSRTRMGELIRGVLSRTDEGRQAFTHFYRSAA
jgi:hypothetical protein